MTQQHPPTTLRTHPRPAAIGYQCDAVYINPNCHPASDEPLLIRCPAPATVRMVIADPADTYAVKRCDICAAILWTRVGRGAMFKILSEQKL